MNNGLHVNHAAIKTSLTYNAGVQQGLQLSLHFLCLLEAFNIHV